MSAARFVYRVADRVPAAERVALAEAYIEMHAAVRSAMRDVASVQDPVLREFLRMTIRRRARVARNMIAAFGERRYPVVPRRARAA